MRKINCEYFHFNLNLETRLDPPQNSKITSNKFSSVEKTMNNCFLAYLVLLLLEVVNNVITLIIIIIN